jgi:hypothetical protein
MWDTHLTILRASTACYRDVLLKINCVEVEEFMNHHYKLRHTSVYQKKKTGSA